MKKSSTLIEGACKKVLGFALDYQKLERSIELSGIGAVQDVARAAQMPDSGTGRAYR